MNISLGFSPCPNDTLIFDALVHGQIDTMGYSFEPVLADVETLNLWASQGKLQVTKLSFPALFQNLEKYVLLQSGAALGSGVGPLLVAKKLVDVPDLAHARIAIPGERTTANFLLQFAFPHATNKIAMPFDHIEDAVLNDEVDLGLLIHENRFTYMTRGLHAVADLGAIWEVKQSCAIPLGGIAIQRNMAEHVKKDVEYLIKKSVQFGIDSYPVITPYVSMHAQAMDEEIMRKHIMLYVNNFTVSLGNEGLKAVEKLYEVYCQATGAENSSGTALSLT